MFLASHQALLSGNSARRLMCAGGAAEYSANSAQQIWILCHMTAPKGAEKPQHVTAQLTLFQTKTRAQRSSHKTPWCPLVTYCLISQLIVNLNFAYHCRCGSTASWWLAAWVLHILSGHHVWLIWAIKRDNFLMIWITSCTENNTMLASYCPQ